MEKAFRVKLAVAFLLTVQKPQVEVALMISGLKRLINELLCDSQFIRELKSSYDSCDNTKYIPMTELHLISWSRYYPASRGYIFAL